jgi:multiple sugar transport system permease protein
MREKYIGLLFVLPVFFLVFCVIGFPFVYTLYLSFTDKRVGYPAHFIGFQNYLTNFKDSQYWLVLKNSFIYTVSCISLKLIGGMIFALLLNEKFRGRSIIRVGMLLPWAIPGMVAANTWKWMYNGQYGIINALLRRWHIIEMPINWLGSVHLALLSVIIVNVWRGIPFFLFTILGGLQTIDDQLYDAGKIDGASMVQRFLYITLPSVIPVIAIATLLSSIWTFNDFDNIWLITAGGPLNASSVVATYTYDVAFIQNLMARSVAVAVSIIPILLLMMIVVLRRTKGYDL